MVLWLASFRGVGSSRGVSSEPFQLLVRRGRIAKWLEGEAVRPRGLRRWGPEWPSGVARARGSGRGIFDGTGIAERILHVTLGLRTDRRLGSELGSDDR